MDYRENFVRAFDSSIDSTGEILGLLENDIVDIQNVIIENQKNLPLLQLSHYVKYYFVGLFDNISIMEKRMKDISEFRKLSQKLPFRVIVKILTYFSIRHTSKVKVTDLYCYFSFDPFRKVFQVFQTTNRSLRKETPKNVTSLYLDRISENFRRHIHKFPNLEHLVIGSDITFPELHPDSCRRIKRVEVTEFSVTRNEGMKSCNSLEELHITRIVDTATSPVFVCTEFPKLKELTFYQGSGLNQYWEFYKIKSLKKLHICDSNYVFDRAQIVLLLSSCLELEELEIGKYNEGLDFQFLHLFFMYGYSLKKVEFYNLLCPNWYLLNGFTPMDKYRMEQIKISNYETEGHFFPVELFNFMCKYYTETMKHADIEFPKEGEEQVHTGILGDLSPLTSMKKLDEICITRSVFQSKRKSAAPLSLDFCCESLKDLRIQNYVDKVEEFLFLGLDPSKFVKLKTISFDNYVGGGCGINESWISSFRSLPVLKKIRLYGEFDSKNWYELFMIPTVKEIDIYKIKSSLFDDYALTPEKALTTEADLKFSDTFNIPENNLLKELKISQGVNYPWGFIFQITKKCHNLVSLVLNDHYNFSSRNNTQTEKLEELEEKLAEMKVYIFKNMLSLPKLEVLDMNVPNSTMAKREFGRQNMFSFTISSDRFVEHREKELKILDKHSAKILSSSTSNQEETEGEEEEEEEEEKQEEEETTKKKKPGNVMYRMFKKGGSLLTEKGKNLFSMASRMKREVLIVSKDNNNFFSHPIHEEETKEIKSIFSKIDTLQIMLLPKPLLLKILNEFIELKIKSKHRPLNIKKLFGYFRWDRDRKIVRVFSSIVLRYCTEMKFDEITQFCKFHSLRFDNVKCMNIFKDFKPLGLPRILRVKKGSTGKFSRKRRKGEQQQQQQQQQQEEEEEEEEDDDVEIIKKKKKFLYRKVFERLESISFVDVKVTKEFIEELVNPEYGVVKRMKRLEFVYSKLTPELLEFFLRRNDHQKLKEDQEEWCQLKKFRIVQYYIQPQVIERLKEKFGDRFEYSKFTKSNHPKCKKKKKKKKD